MPVGPLYVTYGFLVLGLFVIACIIRIEIKLKKFLSGKNAKSLEDTIVTVQENIGKLNEFQREAVLHFVNVSSLGSWVSPKSSLSVTLIFPDNPTSMIYLSVSSLPIPFCLQ